ncbi:MAG: hypothetical protein IJ834_02065 [Paludibacteraceae bacterium]|nr:hypothetical protein [Paludibacteraceae bacterium]
MALSLLTLTSSTGFCCAVTAGAGTGAYDCIACCAGSWIGCITTGMVGCTCKVDEIANGDQPLANWQLI